MVCFIPGNMAFTATWSKCIPNYLGRWHFGLYVSEFWNIHANIPKHTG